MERYFYKEIRGNTSQLIKRRAMFVIKPEQAPKPNDQKAKERLDLWLHELEKELLEKINAQLQKHKYMAGEGLSIVDFIFFCELNQVKLMYDREFPQHLTKLHEWYEEVGNIEPLKEVSHELSKVIE